MNDLTDQFDAAPDTGEMGRTFSFRGVPLKPMSYEHAFAFWRFPRTPLNFERAILLLFLLTRPADVVNGIRSEKDQLAAFADSIKWVKSVGGDMSNDFAAEVIAKAQEVEDDLTAATSVQPKAGKRAPND